MAEGRELAGVVVDDHSLISRCKACGAPIWWGFTQAKKRCPFDVDRGVRTAITHFSTCPKVRQFSKARGGT